MKLIFVLPLFYAALAASYAINFENFAGGQTGRPIRVCEMNLLSFRVIWPASVLILYMAQSVVSCAVIVSHSL